MEADALATESELRTLSEDKIRAEGEKKRLLMSGGLGTMGYGLPGAIGAKIGNPDTPVISISGDGGMQMNIQELGTLVVEGLDVKMVVINNMHLGMVAQWEDLFYNHRRGNTAAQYDRA